MGDLGSPARRAFLQASAAAGAGLVVGFHFLPRGVRAAPAADAPAAFAPNAFLRIAPDNSVTVIVKHLEMGQGVHTGLPTLVAEELDADWASIRVEAAPADVARYGNLAWGGSAQGTGGSTSLTGSWEQLRHAGATARALLVAAAAQNWKVDAARLKTDKGHVLDPKTGRRVAYGELANLAATLPAPAEVKLKPPAQWKLIGKPLARKDTPAKVDGTALFASDLHLPGMLTALIARPPRFGAKLKRLDAAVARAVPGVQAVVETPRGVAVVARDFWSAKRAREALVVEWDDSAAEKRSSDDLRREYLALLEQPGTPARSQGAAEAALAGAARRVEATFEFPYLAHAAMEPLACVVRLGAGRCEVWAGSQLQTLDQAVAAQVAGLKPEQVTIHTVFAGGSFGRHANATADYIAEGVMVAKATEALGAPIRLLWTREDDMQGGYYRPMYLHRIGAGLDRKGNPVSWSHRIVGQSITAGTPFAGMIKNGIDATSVEGAANLPYAIPNLLVDLHTTQNGVPVLWWRSVGSTHTAFSTEVMIDELAAAAGQDPVEFRRRLLKDHPRHRAVLELAARKSGWGKPLPKGRARGVALHESFNSYVAEVVEIALAPDGGFKVERVVCAVDCGVAVNPDVVRAQMESGIVFGLSAALYGAITLKDGRVEQSNFSDYALARIHEVPKIEVHIVPSTAAPTGVGEPGVPPLAPALANALRAATGKPVRRLPLRA
jgi:isoquinoline 1-oxidoreductase beta subunit